MKIYEDKMAPNPRRVRVFLAEKGVDMDYVQVDIGKGEHKQPEFLRKSPLALLPVLEMDDGSYLSETVAICRYFEGLQPTPSLFGAELRQQADIEMWNRRMELSLFLPVVYVFRNTHDFFKDVLPQVPEFGEVSREQAMRIIDWLDAELGRRAFIAGDEYSIADITALCALDFGRITGTGIQPDHSNLKRWHEQVNSRPSATA